MAEVKVTMDAPKLADFDCFEDYKDNCVLWQLTTDHPPKKQGPLLAAGIKNSHTTFGEGLQKRLFQKHKPASLAAREDGVTAILDFLENELGNSKRSQKIKFLKKVVNYKRTADQNVADFVKEFEYLMNKAEENGTKFDPDIKVHYIMENANLTKQQHELLNTIVDIADEKKVYESVKTKMVDMLSNNFEVTNNEEGKLNDAFYAQHEEAFVAWSKKKYQGRQNNNFQGSAAKKQNSYNNNSAGHSNSFSRDLPENPQDLRGRTITCRICGSFRHLQRECPYKNRQPTQSKNRQAFIIEGETDEDVTYDQIDINSTDQDNDNIQKAIFFTTDKRELSKFTAETLNACALDTCCTSSVAGTKWMDIYKQSLPKHLLSQLTGPHKSKTTFMFGNQQSLPSLGLYKIPVIIANQLHVLDVDIINSDIPLLMSKDHMRKIGIALDMSNDTATANGIPLKINTTSAGHYTLSLLGENDTEDTLVMQQLMLTELQNKDEKKQYKMLQKIHSQFGHRPKRVFVELLKSADQWRDDFDPMIDKILNSCEGCHIRMRNPARPVVAIAMSNDFNQLLSMDIKIYKGKYILYLIDTFTRYTIGTVIKSKEPEQVVKALMEKWIRYFQKPKEIITDNGGEFTAELIKEVASRLDIKLHTTPAESPHGNGICEKNHHLSDSILENVNRDFPEIDLEQAVAWSCAAKNSLTTVYGFSPFQLVFGRQPNLPNILEEPPNTLEEKSVSKALEDNMTAMHACRTAFVKSMNCSKLKLALRTKIRTADYEYKHGQWVYYKRLKDNTWLGPAKVVFQDGKLIMIRHGSSWCRVHANRIIPMKKELAEKLNLEMPGDSNLNTNDSKTTASSQTNTNNPSTESTTKLIVVENNTTSNQREPTSSNETDDNIIANDIVENNEVDDLAENNEVDDDISPNDTSNTMETAETDTTTTAATTTAAEQANTENTATGENNKKKPGRPPKKSTPKQAAKIMLKKNETVQIKLDGQWKNATVTQTMKRSGKYPNWYNFQLEDGEALTDDVENLEIRKIEQNRQERPEIEDNDIPDLPAEVLAVMIPTEEKDNPDVVKAKMEELDKLKEFKVYEEVTDEGQEYITTTWVLTRKEGDARARLTARGFQELGNFPKDSPTLHKFSLRIILIIAANKRWSISTTDVRSAFLQGNKLERIVFVKPPKEAKLEKVLWLLKKALYGLRDASKMWYNKVEQILKGLGFKVCKYDSGLFYYQDNEGNLQGILGLHVDDFLHSGSELFNEQILPLILNAFKIGKSETQNFMYTGFQLSQDSQGITLDQEAYVDRIKIPNTDPSRIKQPQLEMTPPEMTLLRQMVGAINWTVRATRPDLAFDLINLSTKFNQGTVADLKNAKKTLLKLKDHAKVRISAIKDMNRAELWMFSDASHGNLNEGVDSTAGYILFLVDVKTGDVAPIEWKSNKIDRVTSSTLAAEAISMHRAMDAAIATKWCLQDILGGKFQFPVKLIVDNNDAFEAVHSATDVQERRLRREIGAVKSELKQGSLEKLVWVPGDMQVADILTKKGVNPIAIREILHKGKMPMQVIKAVLA